MLHGDCAERRQRVRELEHALRQVGIEANALPLACPERPGLVPDRIRHPEAAEVVDEPGPAQCLLLVGTEAEDAAGGRGELGYRGCMTERVRRLQVNEIRDRKQRAVDLLARELHSEARLGVDDGVPGADRVEPHQQHLPLPRDEIRQDRIELRSGTVPSERLGRLDTTDPVRDLHELCDLREPRGKRYLVARAPPRPPTPIPGLVGGAEGIQHLLAQAELLTQRPRHRRVVGDHPLEVAAPRDRELEPDTEAEKRRIPASELLQGCHRPADAPELVVVLRRLEPDVVTKPLRLLVRVGVTADVDQQRRVIHDGPRVLVQPDPLAETEGN